MIWAIEYSTLDFQSIYFPCTNVCLDPSEKKMNYERNFKYAGIGS